jgi:hypothetical protein
LYSQETIPGIVDDLCEVYGFGTVGRLISGVVDHLSEVYGFDLILALLIYGFFLTVGRLISGIVDDLREIYGFRTVGGLIPGVIHNVRHWVHLYLLCGPDMLNGLYKKKEILHIKLHVV